MLMLLSALWLALAYGSEMSAIRDNLGWYIGGSAVDCESVQHVPEVGPGVEVVRVRPANRVLTGPGTTVTARPPWL
jgi:hypothetical protein